MVQFYYNKYVNNYEIDYSNDLTKEEKIELSNKLRIPVEYIAKCFYKSGNDWSFRLSGMTFNIKNSNWYPKIKKHLDKEFEKFMRKEKIKQINGMYRNNNIL